MRVALLTNMLPPYRIEFFGRLAERCDLLVVADTDIERTRSWDVDLSKLPFRCELLGSSGVRLKKKRKDLGYEEPHVLHFGKRIPKVLEKFAPEVIVSGEMGVRSLRAMKFGRKHRVPLVLWWEGTHHTEAAEPFYKRFVRKRLVGAASGFWTNGKESTTYLEGLGADGKLAQEAMTGVSTEAYRSEVGKLLYAYTTFILFKMVYTAINVPYSALMGVITDNNEDRVALSTFRFRLNRYDGGSPRVTISNMAERLDRVIECIGAINDRHHLVLCHKLNQRL